MRGVVFLVQRLVADHGPARGLHHLHVEAMLVCEGFDLCEGYLRFVDTNFDCDPFLEVFSAIKATAKEIADDLAKAEELGE